MSDIIKLPPYDAIKGRSIGNGSYIEYKKWRKSKGHEVWRRKQWGKQSGQCFYCRCDLTKVKVNVEHVIPQRMKSSGINSAKNLVLSCAKCNKQKGGSRLKKNTIKKYRNKNNAIYRKGVKEWRYNKYKDEKILEDLSWIN